jgi:y4mF family transcriptional regulator
MDLVMRRPRMPITPAKSASPREQRLAQAIRRRRRELGLTQLALGELSGCGLAFLYDLERGKPTLRLDKLLDVLSVLGLELVLTNGKSALRVEDALFD